MPKLSDAQLVVLSAASQRDDRSVLPLTLKHKGAAADKVLNSLLRSSLIEECPAGLNDEVWRQADDGTRLTLRATAAAFEALGIEAETGPAIEASAQETEPAPEVVAADQNPMPAKKVGAPAKKPGPTKSKSQSKSKSKPAAKAPTKAKPASKPTPKAKTAKAKTAKTKPAAGKPATPKKPGATRDNSKQAQLIKMLERSQGASLDEIVKALEWQAHTVRGAIAGALKKKLGLDVISEKSDNRGRIYRIAG